MDRLCTKESQAVHDLGRESALDGCVNGSKVCRQLCKEGQKP